VRRARWRTAGAVSLAFHIAFLAVLAWQLGRQPAPVEPPVIDVRLVTLTPRRPPEAPRADRPERQIAGRARQANTAPSIAPAPIAPSPAPAADPSAAGVARVLRRAVGCDHANLMRLGPEERQRCEQRIAAAEPPSGRLNLDPSGRYAENPEPYLQRRPTKGCKPRAGGAPSPMGDDSIVTTGITCAIPF
jgi:hypothetical protein